MRNKLWLVLTKILYPRLSVLIRGKFAFLRASSVYLFNGSILIFSDFWQLRQFWQFSQSVFSSDKVLFFPDHRITRDHQITRSLLRDSASPR
jgi:hypothetical protein